MFDARERLVTENSLRVDCDSVQVFPWRRGRMASRFRVSPAFRPVV
jgi:hypothetical protein